MSRHITAREDFFEYRIKSVINEIKEEHSEDIEESGEAFSDWLWTNRETLGEKVFDDIETYMGMDEFDED